MSLPSTILYQFQLPWTWFGVKRSEKRWICWVFLLFFQLIRTKCDVALAENICLLILSEIYLIKGNNCCFTDHIRNQHMLVCIWMFMNNLFQTWYDDSYCWTLQLDTGQNNLDLFSRLQECERAKTAILIILDSFCFGWNLVGYWDSLSDESHIYFFLHGQYVRVRTLLRWFHEKRKGKTQINPWYWLAFGHSQIDFIKLSIMMDTTTLYSLMPVWMILTIILDHNCI